MIKFNYNLKKVKDCEVNNDSSKQVRWFYLTDGYYYIELDQIKLFEYNDKIVKEYKLKQPFLDYYIIRLIEDVFELLQNIASPMPLHLFKLVDTYEKRKQLETKINEIVDKLDDKNDEYNQLFELYYLAGQGTLNTSYLNPGFYNCFYHVDDYIYFFYNCNYFEENVWTAKHGEVKIQFDEFLSQFKLFVDNFMQDMEKQIEDELTLIKNNPNIYKCEIDLYQEHVNRKEEFNQYFENIITKNIFNQNYWNNIELLMKKYNIKGE